MNDPQRYMNLDEFAPDPCDDRLVWCDTCDLPVSLDDCEGDDFRCLECRRVDRMDREEETTGT